MLLASTHILRFCDLMREQLLLRSSLWSGKWLITWKVMTPAVQDPAVIVRVLAPKQKLVLRIVLLLVFDQLYKAGSIFHGKLSKFVQDVCTFCVSWGTSEVWWWVPRAEELSSYLRHNF